MLFFTFEGDEIDVTQLQTLAEDGVSVYHKNIPFSAQSLLDASTDFKQYKFETIPKHISRFSTVIHEFVHDAGETIAGYVELEDLYTSIPSAIEVILCKFILDRNDIDLLTGNRLIFFQENFPECLNGVLVREFFKSDHANFFSMHNSSMFEALDEEYPPQMLRIVKNACSSANSKYKILEYYRALEALFLQNILRKINEDYPVDPKKTLEQAVDSLKKERDQLVSLMSHKGQTTVAREINRLIERKNADGNRYCSKLMEKFAKNKEKPTLDDDGAWRGCWYIYQIRCSIAHAGTDNIVYEYFDDSDDIVAELAPIMEQILLGCIGISV